MPHPVCVHSKGLSSAIAVTNQLAATVHIQQLYFYDHTYTHAHTHTHPFYGPLDCVQDYLGEPVPEPIWILLKQEWQPYQLGHMQICTLTQTDNHASTPPLSFLQAGCPSCCPTNSIKALKASYYYNCKITENVFNIFKQD